MKFLEQRSCPLQFEVGWVHQLMVDIGVPALRLLELYDRMFKSRVSKKTTVLTVTVAVSQLINR